MAWMMDAFSATHGYSPAIVTGKPLDLGGAPGREAATGRGCTYVLDAWCEHHGLRLADQRVAIQGFGNVGSWMARELHERGATVVGVSDVRGAIVDPAGVDVAGLVDLVQLGAVGGGRRREATWSPTRSSSSSTATCWCPPPSARSSPTPTPRRIRARVVAGSGQLPGHPERRQDPPRPRRRGHPRHPGQRRRRHRLLLRVDAEHPAVHVEGGALRRRARRQDAAAPTGSPRPSPTSTRSASARRPTPSASSASPTPSSSAATSSLDEQSLGGVVGQQAGGGQSSHELAPPVAVGAGEHRRRHGAGLVVAPQARQQRRRARTGTRGGAGWRATESAYIASAASRSPSRHRLVGVLHRGGTHDASSTRRRSSPSGSAWSSTRTSIEAIVAGDDRTAIRPRPRAAPTAGRGCRRPPPRRRRARPSSRVASGPALAAKAVGHRLGDARVVHHVGLHREAVADDVAGVLDARARRCAPPLAPSRRRSPPGGSPAPGRRHRARRRAPPPGSRPARSRASPSGPWATSAVAWVATAPTPASSHGTTEPTEKKCDCTATPSCPVSGQRATIE